MNNNHHRINRIARNVIAAQGKNVFEDYFLFYADGKWIIQIIRDIIVNLGKLYTISNFVVTIPALQEDNNYLQQTKLDEMSTSSSHKQLKKYLQNIKKTYEYYMKEQKEQNKAKIMQGYKKEIDLALTLMKAYESSCVNIFRNRFIEDQDNVNNLLDTIRDCGNYVFNSNKGEK